MLADLMNFGSHHTYEQFIQNASHLSELETFPVLCSRAAAVGFTIGKVRGGRGLGRTTRFPRMALFLVSRDAPSLSFHVRCNSLNSPSVLFEWHCPLRSCTADTQHRRSCRACATR